MHLSKNFLETIQCYATKYQHILYEPILLECGHSACKKCAIEIGQFYCNYKNCNQLIEINEASQLKSVKSIEHLIESNFNHLYENNVRGFTQILTSIQDEECSNEIDEHAEWIESQILERAQFLKNQIDNFAEEMCASLERKSRKLKRLISIEAGELVPLDELETEITKEMFYDSQNKLIELKQIMKEFCKNNENPYFEPNNTKLDKSIIGELRAVNCDSIFLKHRLLNNPNPFQEIELGFEPYNVCPINSDYLCVTYPNNGKIDILSKDYQIVSSIDKIKSASLNSPRGIAFSSNQLVICDSFSHRLIVTDLNLEKLEIFGKYGSGESAEFYSPFDAIYNNGFLYVCDTGNKRVIKFTDNFAYLRAFSLDYFPIQIMILSSLVIIRDDKNYLNFHYLDTFKRKKKSKNKGISGIVDKCVYQIDKNFVYFYDSDSNLSSKSRINCTYEFNNGCTCVFNKDIVITSNSKLILIKNLF